MTQTFTEPQLPPGPNDVLPCPRESARRRHLALGQECPLCETWATVQAAAAALIPEDGDE